MKTLELTKMEKINAGSACTDLGLGFTVGATVAGTAVAGPIGFMVGGLIGVIGGSFISIAGGTNNDGSCGLT